MISHRQHRSSPASASAPPHERGLRSSSDARRRHPLLLRFTPLKLLLFLLLCTSLVVIQFCRFPNFEMLPRSPKYILYSSRYWNSTDFQFGQGQAPFVNAKCPINDCIITSNRSYLKDLSDFDAFVVHAHHDVVTYEMYLELKKARKNHHRFVLLALESPLFTNRRIPYRSDRHQLPFLDSRDILGNENVTDPYDDFFHYVMSYRWDSDIPFPYGWFQDKKPPSFLPKVPRSWRPFVKSAFLASLPARPDSFRALARRPKKVAWVVSNCDVPSNRKAYVEELKKYISVDVYGQCGTITCNSTYDSRDPTGCSNLVTKDYKFYLAFENAYCNDYVTEKFFAHVDNNLAIVMGQANYSVIAPPHSHLNVKDFANPKELAQFLHELDQDHARYLSYFWWKDHYQVLPYDGDRNVQSWCHLCEKLHKNEVNVPTYSRLQDWWHEPSECNREGWGGTKKEARVDNFVNR